MRDNVVFQVTRRGLCFTVVIAFLLALLGLLAHPLQAQKVQETYKDKFSIAEGTGGVAIAASGDGRYVFVAGRNGVIVSDDYGKTGTWVQTVRMK